MTNRRDFLKNATAVVAGSTVFAGSSHFASAAAVEPAAVQPPRRIIALEEHFMLPEFVGYLHETQQNLRNGLVDKVVTPLSDFGKGRLEIMDKNGVDFAVLSLSGPGVQAEPDKVKAVRLARYANDKLATEMQKNPRRYGGFAHLAMQDPLAAANELERCVKQLHMQGGMINGETDGLYLDDRRYDVFWERVEALNVPIYIHPGNPPDYPHMFAGHPEMWGPVWSWAVETCSHALRLIFSGTFDRYPGARVILGHMGETLPIQLWRLDSRYQIANQKFAIEHPPSWYAKKNITITTSGVCNDAALRCALDSMGGENVMFSIDYPFESTEIAVNWLKTAKISEQERNAVAWGNATTILRLGA